MTHRVVSLAVVVFACLGLWRAVGWEAAQAGGRSERERGMNVLSKPGGSPSRSESLYQGKPAIWWARRAVQARKDANARGLTIKSLRRQVALLERLNLDPVLAIRVVFGPYSAQALRVSSCETGGTFYTGARNGQYLGLFQMGSYARATYGHSSTALGQARAAYRYFVASGRDWSPWTCRP